MLPAVGDIVGRFTTYIINPLILLIVAAGFFLFVWGLIEFLWGLREGEVANTGKQHMLWGIIGMTVMVSVFGIIGLINNTFGLGLTPTNSGGTNYDPNVGLINSVTAPSFNSR